MELIVAFIIGMILLWMLSEPESLADYFDRMHINRLAARSLKRKPPSMRRACQYAKTGWRPER